jgi:EAL domain-containing protein (putative c-di-GMP-specific phosphodiesterase class I)
MIVEGLVGMFARMNIAVVAEGIETIGEFETLRDLGVRYMQGYLLARPGFKCLPDYALPQSPCIQQVA